MKFVPHGIGKERQTVRQMNYRRAERRRQISIVERMKDVEREDLWRFVMTSDLISLSIDNRELLDSRLYKG
jgi:hypothetical protein